MSAPRHLEYVHLRVRDLPKALDYFVGFMGLVEFGRQDGLVHLGAGLDENVDLVLEEGGTGVACIGLRVNGPDELQRYKQRLTDAGVDIDGTVAGLPGHEASVCFESPGGIRVDLVTVEDRRYLEPYRTPNRGRRGLGLLDIDHVTVMHADPHGYAMFFSNVLGFLHSDVICVEPDVWLAAWMRMGTYHHDLAVLGAPGPSQTLHHLAWTCESIDHLKTCCDRLSDAGIRLEVGIGRHPAGSNLFAYYRDPSGNRTELSAEMANIEPRSPVRYWTDLTSTFDAWAEHQPSESFRQGT